MYPHILYTHICLDTANMSAICLAPRICYTPGRDEAGLPGRWEWRRAAGSKSVCFNLLYEVPLQTTAAALAVL